MKIPEVIRHYLLSLETRRCSPNTLTLYRYSLNLLADLLVLKCEVTELEQVTVLHLRQCVQYLLTTRIEIRKSRRPPENGSTLSASTVVSYMRPWRSFFNHSTNGAKIEPLRGKNLDGYSCWFGFWWALRRYGT